ncbi:MAG: O-antigen ligase family protein [Acidobacteriia bacterium]|nr:O-antigen ligase family protein [Terriglobia bacterium]
MNPTFVEVVLSILLVILPWAFGGALPWTKFLIEAVAGSLALMWVISLLRKEKITFVATALQQLSLFTFLYAASTIMHLPHGLVRWLSPKSAQASDALLNLGVNIRPIYRLSMDPMRTVDDLLLFGSYFVIFFAIVNTYGSKDRIRRFFYLIAGNGLLLSLFALVQRAFWNGKLYWVVPTESGTSFGSYFNHNNFAGYIELALGACIAITLSRFASPGDFRVQGWRKKFVWIASHEVPVVFLGMFVLVILLTAIIYSLSRGALLALVLALPLTKMLLPAHRASTLRIPLVPFVLVLVVVSALALIGASTLVHRFSNLASYTNMYRLDMWHDSARMIKDFPLFGVGLGAFNEVFPAYKRSHFEVKSVYLESDWLQAVIELGFIGMTLIALMVWVFFKNVRLRYSQRRDKEIRSYLFGGTIGLLALMAHSLLDFNFHMPANALTAFAMAAVVLITATTREEGERSITPTVVGTLTPRSRTFMLLTVGSLGCLFLVLSYYSFQTQSALMRWRSIVAHPGTITNYDQIFARPRWFLPLASEWRYGRGTAFEMEAARPGYNMIESADLRRNGIMAANGALELAPGCGEYWALRARLYSELNEHQTAEDNYLQALRCDISNYEILYQSGVALLRAGKIPDGVVQIGRARTMANVIPLEPTFNFVMAYTRDPQLLSEIVIAESPDDLALFHLLMQRNGL